MPYTFLYVSFLVLFLFVIFYLYFRYRKIDKSSFLEIFDDTFKLNLPVMKIICYRLAVCRDYAKLTAAVLLNLYPKNKIYFYTYPGHVATGIEISGRIYILDQRLPIVDETAWLILKNRENATKLELKRGNGEYFVEYPGKITIREKSELKDLKTLVEEVKKAIKDRQRKVTYILKGKAKIYDITDEIIKKSLLRRVTLTLQNEFSGNFQKIRSIEINEDRQ